MRKIIFFILLVFMTACGKDKEEEIITLEKVRVGDYNLIDIGCSKFYTYYLSFGNSTTIKFTEVKNDTFKMYSLTDITYKITYKKLSVDKCNTFLGVKDFEIVEIISAKRD